MSEESVDEKLQSVEWEKKYMEKQTKSNLDPS